MDMEKKTSHRYCLLSAIDGSTTAGKKLAIGRGWQPLVYLGIPEPSVTYFSENQYSGSYVENFGWKTQSLDTRGGL